MKSNWINYISNKEGLLHLYKEFPNWENVKIVSIDIDLYDGEISIIFKLPAYPDYPSPRWDPSNNAISIKILFYGTFDLFLKNFFDHLSNEFLDLDVLLEIRSIPDQEFCKTVLIKNQNLYLKFCTDWIVIDRIYSDSVNHQC